MRFAFVVNSNMQNIIFFYKITYFLITKRKCNKNIKKGIKKKQENID